MSGGAVGETVSAIQGNPRMRAYFFQYTSLMLIILTFVIGSSIRKLSQSSTNQPVPVETVASPEIRVEAVNQATAPKSQAEFKVSERMLEYPGIFSDANLLTVTEELIALKDVMLQHDISVKCDVMVPVGNLKSGVLRSRALFDFFATGNIPASAVKIFATFEGADRPNINGARCSLIREGDAI